MSISAVTFDPPASLKARFAATVLPALGLVGGFLRANGSSDQIILIVTIPLLCAGFFGLRLLGAATEARNQSERAYWLEHDQRSIERLKNLADDQREEIEEIRHRQRAEQEQLLRERAPSDQWARMMERHRSEYEALLNRLSA